MLSLSPLIPLTPMRSVLVCYFSLDTVVLFSCLIILAYELVFPGGMATPRGKENGEETGQTINSDEFKEP